MSSVIEAGWVREPIILSDDDLWAMSEVERDELNSLLATPLSRGEVWREDGSFGARIKVLDCPSLTNLPRQNQ